MRLFYQDRRNISEFIKIIHMHLLKGGFFFNWIEKKKRIQWHLRYKVLSNKKPYPHPGWKHPLKYLNIWQFPFSFSFNIFNILLLCCSMWSSIEAKSVFPFKSKTESLCQFRNEIFEISDSFHWSFFSKDIQIMAWNYLNPLKCYRSVALKLILLKYIG